MLKIQSRNIPFYIVDVFGQEKYTGNQLAVFPDSADISDEEMQVIARETNFSETTFITGSNQEKGEVDVRIFTPGKELPFAGHPTLGTAYVANNLFFEEKLSKITVNVKAGRIPVTFDGDIAWMTQIQPEFTKQSDRQDIADLLGLEDTDLNQHFPVEQVSTGIPFFIIPVNTLKALKKARLNGNVLHRHSVKYNSSEFMVFTQEKYNQTDFISARVFVPEYGIGEDPATGSANGCLAAYILKNNLLGNTEIDFSVAQGYEIGRPQEYLSKLLCWMGYMISG